MEKIAFTLEGEGTAWFYVLEQTMIGGRHYLLVTEEEEGDCDALILKEIPQEEDTDSIYEIRSWLQLRQFSKACLKI